MARAQEKKIIFTVGHSTRTIEEFIELLLAHGVEQIADVRSIPRSGYNPQFNETGISLSLKKAGIAYRHIEKLGGLRHVKKDSVNLGWKNKSFRGYADYMGTQSFTDGLDMLMKIAVAKKTAIMCAEAVPWRCHRSMISDVLMKKKWRVEDITGKGKTHKHTLTPFLRVRKGKIVYPEAARQLTIDFNFRKKIFPTKLRNPLPKAVYAIPLEQNFPLFPSSLLFHLKFLRRNY